VSGGAFQETISVALDDFCSATRLFPSLVKVDIEGAEFDALNGAQQLISQHRPHLILEQQAGDDRCLAWLHAQDYVAIDLASYRMVRSSADFPKGSTIRNVLFVHESRIAELAYGLPPVLDTVRTLLSTEVRSEIDGYKAGPIRLDAGRYVIDANFHATGTHNHLECGVESFGGPIMRYEAYSRLLAETYRDWVVDLPRPTDVNIFFRFVQGTSDDSLRIGDLHIKKLRNSKPQEYLAAIAL
jgi:hypothetical protein